MKHSSKQNDNGKSKEDYINEGYRADKEKNNPVHFYQQNGFILLMLFFCAPVGIFLLFRFGKWSKFLKLSAAILSLIWFLFVIFSEYPPAAQDTSVLDTYPSFMEKETDETLSSENTIFSESEEESKTSDITAKNEKSTAVSEHTKSPTEAPFTEKATEQSTLPEPIGSKYVLNTNTKVYHRPNCRYTEKIKAENYLLSSTVPSDYRPCKVCKP